MWSRNVQRVNWKPEKFAQELSSSLCHSAPPGDVQGVPEKMLSCLKFCVRVVLIKLDFLRDACAEFLAYWAPMKNVKLRILELPLLG